VSRFEFTGIGSLERATNMKGVWSGAGKLPFQVVHFRILTATVLVVVITARALAGEGFRCRMFFKVPDRTL
jgi:hypothetical protein